MREKFLSDLFDACHNNVPIRLDFVYGEADDHVLLPFDGQQRLTTLFLLHWYAAARQGILAGEIAVRLGKFRYQVREGVRLFGDTLVGEGISEEHPVHHHQPYDQSAPEALSNYIKDQAWFRDEWHFDPTVSGILVMLDAIHKYFHAMDDLWEKLEGDQPPITFYFEALSELALSADETFIKMNARGKQLTEFEHFKARFIGLLKQDGVINADEIAEKFDNQWTNLFWTSFAWTDDDAEDDDAEDDDAEDRAGTADHCFVTYLRFLADIFLSWPSAPGSTENDQLLPQADKDDLFDSLRAAYPYLEMVFKLADALGVRPGAILDASKTSN